MNFSPLADLTYLWATRTKKAEIKASTLAEIPAAK